MTSTQPLGTLLANTYKNTVAENERLREAVEWYGERAHALTDYKDKSASYLEAVYVELSLDGGRRARAALKEPDDA